MAMTQRQVERLPGPEPGKAQRVHVTDTPGLLVVVGKRRRTFAGQFDMLRDGRRVSVRKKLEAEQIAEARIELGRLRADMAKGRDPSVRRAKVQAPSGPVTLGDALDAHREHLELNGRQTGEVKYLRRFFAALEKVPLSDLTLDRLLHVQTQIAQGKHPELTKGKGSKPTANKALGLAKAAWKRAVMKLGAPPSPFEAHEWKELRIKIKPVRHWMANEQFPAFWEATSDMSPAMRRYWRLLLLSGARRRTLAGVLREGYDPKARRLHFHRDKTGPYAIPLSDTMVQMVEEQLKDSEGSKHLFPRARARKAKLEDRPMVEPKHPAMRALGLSPHALRRTYKNLCADCEASQAHEHALLNHADAGMDAVYRSREKIQKSPTLAAVQERITQHALRLCGEPLDSALQAHGT